MNLRSFYYSASQKDQAFLLNPFYNCEMYATTRSQSLLKFYYMIFEAEKY